MRSSQTAYKGDTTEAVGLPWVTAESSFSELTGALNDGQITNARFIVLIGTRQGILQGELAGLELPLPSHASVMVRCQRNRDITAIKGELAVINGLLGR